MNNEFAEVQSSIWHIYLICTFHQNISLMQISCNSVNKMKTCKKFKERQLILQTQKQLTKIFLFMFHSMRPQEYQKSHMAISE